MESWVTFDSENIQVQVDCVSPSGECCVRMSAVQFVSISLMTSNYTLPDGDAAIPGEPATKKHNITFKLSFHFSFWLLQHWTWLGNYHGLHHHNCSKNSFSIYDMKFELNVGWCDKHWGTHWWGHFVELQNILVNDLFSTSNSIWLPVCLFCFQDLLHWIFQKSST